MKFLAPPLQRVHKLFLKFKTILKTRIVKTQCYYVNYVYKTSNYYKTKLEVFREDIPPAQFQCQ